MPEPIEQLGLREIGNLGTRLQPAQQQEQENPGASFGDMLQEALGDVNQKQVEADEITEAFVAGETDDIHQMMIKTQEARLALQLTTQVTNELVTSYQELTNMQI